MKTQKTARSQPVIPLVILSAVLCACVPPTPMVPPKPPTQAEPNSMPGWLEIFFTRPGAPGSENFEGGPDESLAAAIDNARLAVDMAANSLSLESIRDALLRAQKRGVVIRLVMEGDNMGSQEIRQILEAGIPITGDSPDALMLDNFVVIDRNEVWTGSMNFTTGGAYMDNNTLLHMRSRTAAQYYLDEFNPMFDPTLLDPDGGTATPIPTLTLNTSNMEYYFLPEDDITPRVTQLITGATESISYLAPEFFGPILEAAVAEAGLHVKVSGVVDDSMTHVGVPVEGSDVRADGNKPGAMHESVMIIDQRIVIFGSQNFSSETNEIVLGKTSSPNASNVIIFFNPEIAAAFDREFRAIYALAPSNWPSITPETTTTPGETTPPPAP